MARIRHTAATTSSLVMPMATEHIGTVIIVIAGTDSRAPRVGVPLVAHPVKRTKIRSPTLALTSSRGFPFWPIRSVWENGNTENNYGSEPRWTGTDFTVRNCCAQAVMAGAGAIRPEVCSC